MITRTNNVMVQNAYSNNFGDSKDVKSKANASITKQGDTSKVEQLKEAINSGEYKVDLEALSKRIAQELL
ncbi:MAG: flagellar biosynthesis anti-sigma factor FlgM [Campylobacterota bacterium]|nr:flagellar biosynthesis anti-sigma factor FlgM [Campylobacterota bacterium]